MTCPCGATSMARHLINIKRSGESILDAHDYEGQTWDFRPINTNDPDLEFRVVDLKEYLPVKFFDYDKATQARMEELTRALLDAEKLPTDNQAAYEASQTRIIAAEKVLTPVQRFIARDRSR